MIVLDMLVLHARNLPIGPLPTLFIGTYLWIPSFTTFMIYLHYISYLSYTINKYVFSFKVACCFYKHRPLSLGQHGGRPTVVRYRVIMPRARRYLTAHRRRNGCELRNAGPYAAMVPSELLIFKKNVVRKI